MGCDFSQKIGVYMTETFFITVCTEKLDVGEKAKQKCSP